MIDVQTFHEYTALCLPRRFASLDSVLGAAVFAGNGFVRGSLPLPDLTTTDKYCSRHFTHRDRYQIGPMSVRLAGRVRAIAVSLATSDIAKTHRKTNGRYCSCQALSPKGSLLSALLVIGVGRLVPSFEKSSRRVLVLFGHCEVEINGCLNVQAVVYVTRRNSSVDVLFCIPNS